MRQQSGPHLAKRAEGNPLCGAPQSPVTPHKTARLVPLIPEGSQPVARGKRGTSATPGNPQAIREANPTLSPHTALTSSVCNEPPPANEPAPAQPLRASPIAASDGGSIHNAQVVHSAGLANSVAIHPTLRLAFAAHFAHTKESRVLQQESPRGTDLLCGGACRKSLHPLPARAGPAWMWPGDDQTFHAQAVGNSLHARELLNQLVIVHDLEPSRARAVACRSNFRHLDTVFSVLLVLCVLQTRLSSAAGHFKY